MAEYPVSRQEGSAPSNAAGSLAAFIQQAENDWILLSISSFLGFVYTKDYFHYFRTDVFSRRLVFYRKQPIRNEEILAARYLVMLGTWIVMSVCYYIPVYILLEHVGLVGGGTFFASVLLWSGFSIVAGSFYIYLELGFSGKRYLMYSFIIVFLYLAAIAVLALMKIRLIGGTFRLAEHYGAWPSLVVLMAAAAIASGMYRLTLKRLALRDLL